MTTKQAFRPPGEATHPELAEAAANNAARTTAQAVQPATMASAGRVNEAPGPAAVTGRSTDQHPMSIVDHCADAGPATHPVVADEHHPAQPATSAPERYSR
jgi:hypothetical protein